MSKIWLLLLVYGLHKLTDDKRYALDTLDLLLRADKLSLQTPVTELDTEPIRNTIFAKQTFAHP